MNLVSRVVLILDMVLLLTILVMVIIKTKCSSPFQRLMLWGPPMRIHSIGSLSSNLDVTHSTLLGGTSYLEKSVNKPQLRISKEASKEL